MGMENAEKNMEIPMVLHPSDMVGEPDELSNMVSGTDDFSCVKAQLLLCVCLCAWRRRTSRTSATMKRSAASATLRSAFAARQWLSSAARMDPAWRVARR